MQLRPEHLGTHLKKTLNPLYCLWGEELLLIQESADQIRSAALTLGFTERLLFTLESEASFEWDDFISACTTQSLFSEKKMIEILFQTNKITDKGMLFFKDLPKILTDNPDIVLLIRAGSLSPAIKKSSWFTALMQYERSIMIPHPFLDKNQLTNWIVSQSTQRRLKLDAAALQAMSTQNEGNVLAAHQELDMLDFIFNKPGKINPIDLAQYQTIMTLTQQSRFTVFDLQDALLKGDPKRVLHILSALEPSEFILILWAIAKVIRVLIQLHHQLNQNKSLPQAIQALGIWSRSAPLYTQAVKRLSLPLLNQALQQSQQMDTQFKTGEAKQAWRDLISMCLTLSR